MMMISTSSGGTGSRLARTIIIISGVAALLSTLLSLVSIWFQTKNYRKPLLQRYVVRILLMVPIYAASSWTSIVSLKAAQFLDPIRDIYEAFTIYTFFQLLINFLGGERALIIMTHGRPPVQHVWPLNRVLPKVDISDPHTFLAIKRGILQYAWLKPILAIASIILKATDTYQEGYLGLASGYLWTGIIYNISVTLSLYSLAMFWVCMHDDLKPFRPVPKFLCIKLIIFASYWQGFSLSILQWLGAIPNNVANYTPDNLAAAIQDALICIEMPFFAVAHWYAFSWHDYADPAISAARLPVKYAVRDAFGVRDLIEDTKQTLRRENYEYRMFDSGDHVIAHEESSSRVKRVLDGMRYERGGKGKYWIPRPGEVNSRTPLLPGSAAAPHRSSSASKGSTTIDRFRSYGELEETSLNEEDERLFTNARALEFGDWNYPVILANEVHREQRLSSYQSSTRYHHDAAVVRKSHRSRHSKDSDGRSSRQTRSSRSSKTQQRPQVTKPKDGTADVTQPDQGQLRDLVVEDRDAEERERRLGNEAPDALEQKILRRPSGNKVSPVSNGPVSSHEQQFTGPAPSQTDFVVGEDEDDDDKDDPTPATSTFGYSALEDEPNVWDR